MLAVDPQFARIYIDAGATFVAVGADTALLVRAARQLAASFKAGTSAAEVTPT